MEQMKNEATGFMSAPSYKKYPWDLRDSFKVGFKTRKAWNRGEASLRWFNVGLFEVCFKPESKVNLLEIVK